MLGFPPFKVVEEKTLSCVVVTVAYGLEVEAEVIFLKGFRDYIVAKSS